MSSSKTTTLFAALSVSCGTVLFVDPDEALKRQLVIEDVTRFKIQSDTRTYFFVRINGREGIERIRLSASGELASYAIPLETADITPCGVKKPETCISITLGPGLPGVLSHLSLTVPEIGHRSTHPIETVELNAHTVTGYALHENESGRVQIQDPIRFQLHSTEETEINGALTRVRLFPRRFEVHTRPGACSGYPDAADPDWEVASIREFVLPMTFDVNLDLACVAIRPALPPRGPAVAVNTIPAAALLRTFDHVYVPAVETAPMVYQILADLEIPNEERCSAAMDLLESTVRETATLIAEEHTNAEVLGLPPIQIANADNIPCRQDNTRSFAGRAAAERAIQAIDETFGRDRSVRMLFIYASNLNLDAPLTLSASFSVMRDRFRLYDRREDFLLAIAPEMPRAPLNPNAEMEWVAVEEPSFRQSIITELDRIWPFKTMLHTAQTVVPMVSPEDATRYQAYRICSNSALVVPRGELVAEETYSVGPDGPSYLVPDLVPLILEPDNVFSTSLPDVRVSWQGCEDLCLEPPPLGSQSWLLQRGCWLAQ